MTVDEALKLLGLSTLTSAEHVAELWKSAVISSHPDRCRDESLRALANQRIIDLVEARQVLVAELEQRAKKDTFKFSITFNVRTRTYDSSAEKKPLDVPWEW